MIGGKRLLGIIPARGGSKGIPGKNLVPLCGKPLLAWTVEAAQRSELLDRVVLSSEDPAIIAAAQALGCEVPFTRPAELAQDDTPGIAPVLHCLDELGADFDAAVLLQPTSPLRLAADIDAAIRLWHGSGAPSCVSVCEPAESPYWTFVLDEGGRLQPLFDSLPTRRQDLPKSVALNGAIYVADADWLRREETFVTPETVAYEMPRSRSLDVDTPHDLQLVVAVLGSRAGAEA